MTPNYYELLLVGYWYTDKKYFQTVNDSFSGHKQYYGHSDPIDVSYFGHDGILQLNSINCKNNR